MKDNINKLKQEHGNKAAQMQELQHALHVLEGGVQFGEQLLKIARLRLKGAQI
jgi:hypothetical protein